MNDIPEAEARSLLALPSDCTDIGEWIPSNKSGRIFHNECGLMRDGVYANLHVSLIYSYRPDVKTTHFIFTVFGKSARGQFRVFQLDINSNPKAGKNAHNLPHYHWGKPSFYDKRMIGWDFNDAIRFFSQEAKITFIPPPQLPEFKLT